MLAKRFTLRSGSSILNRAGTVSLNIFHMEKAGIVFSGDDDILKG